MDIILEYFATVSWTQVINVCLRILLILAVAWGVMLVLGKVVNRIEDRMIHRRQANGEVSPETIKRTSTLFRLVRQGVHLIIYILVVLVLLKEVGVDIGPILAGAGIVGLAVGFGAQNLVRDVISGFFFILENQVRVGDVAIINGTGGLVEEINFRTIVLRDLSGVVHVFPNGEVTTLSNMTRTWSAYVFEVGVAYKENTDRVTEVIKEVCAGMRADETYGPLILEDGEIFGVNEFGDSSVVIKGRIKTAPIKQWMVGREFLRRIKLAFDEQGIEIPFPHRSVYFGEASRPVELLLRQQAEKLSPPAET